MLLLVKFLWILLWHWSLTGRTAGSCWLGHKHWRERRHESCGWTAGDVGKFLMVSCWLFSSLFTRFAEIRSSAVNKSFTLLEQYVKHPEYNSTQKKEKVFFTILFHILKNQIFWNHLDYFCFCVTKPKS